MKFEKIKTIPGEYCWVNANGIPGIDKMLIGEIRTEARLIGLFNTLAEVILPDGKIVYATFDLDTDSPTKEQGK